MTHSISLIIPIYNAEQYLQECIDSILTQTHQDWELFLIDDGSTDTSASICKEYVSKDSRIHYLHQENAGPNMARKNGLDQSSGEFIIFLDADDKFATEDTLELNLKHFGTYPAASIIAIPQCREQPDGSIDYKKPKAQLLTDKRTIFMNWYNGRLIEGCVMSKIYRKSVFEGWDFNTDLRFTEDNFMIPDMLANLNAIYISDQGAYFYRANPTSAVHTEFTMSKRFDMLRSQIKLYETLWQFEDTKSERQKFYASILEDAFYLFSSPQYNLRTKQHLLNLAPISYSIISSSNLQKMLLITTKLFGIIKGIQFTTIILSLLTIRYRKHII